MKICTICNLEKTLDSFSKKSLSSDGLSCWCRECKKKKDRDGYLKNRNKKLKNSNSYYQFNRERILQEKNKDKISLYNKTYKKEKTEEIKIYNKNYRESHRDTISEQRKKYRLENHDKIREYTRNRLKTDPLFKLSKKLRNRIRDFLKDRPGWDIQKTEQYLGCSLEELKLHLQSKFSIDMTWENHGKIWHIDHVIPMAHAKTEEQLYQLCHWTNLQPLYAKDNLIKNKLLPKNVCWQKLQRDRLLTEDIKNGLPLDTKASDFTLTQEKFTPEHRKFIERYEWLGTCGFGVRYVFTARYNGILGGVVMIAEPNGYQFDKKLEALVQRGACASWTPKNLGSRLVMFACRWMVDNSSKRIFTAYSDPEAGEIGTIYQACNFDYLGNTYGSSYHFKLPTGKLVSQRHFTRTSSMKKYAKELGIEWKNEWLSEGGFQIREQMPDSIKKILDEHAKKQYEHLPRVKKSPKGKYVLLLQKKREKIQKTWASLQYPKRY